MSEALSVQAQAAQDVIAAGRARIDELDAAIIALVNQRKAVSKDIQQARIAAGGRRVEHGRELAIVDRYVQAFGEPGSGLALTVLELCRGPRLSG